MTLLGSKKKVGNYRFTGKVLGKGNFAKVEEAIHNVLNTTVAIKIMDVKEIREDYVVKHLYREGKILLKLNHPCIMSLFETMQTSDNVYYLVTEIVSGGDLCSFVKNQRTGRLEELPTRLYARQFASAIAHMHYLGVVHRDLKLENVMLDGKQTQIKIVDFGLSNLFNPNSLLHTHCGSPEYAAPELFVNGRQYGSEVDLWSLGIILYGMVIGQLPFVTTRNEHVSSQERRQILVAQINKGLSKSHTKALSAFSPEFRSLVTKLLVCDPRKRITIKELIVHPWITDKGKKVIKVNPIKPVGSNWENKMIEQISSLLQTDFNKIYEKIREEPLGRIGGMYRLLKHNFQLKQLHGDGITRALPSLTPLELSNVKKSLEKGKSSPKAVIDKPKKPMTSPAARDIDYYTPRVVIQNKSLKLEKDSSLRAAPKNSKNSNTATKTKSSPPPKARPATVQSHIRPETEQTIDYRSIKSPNLRRKVYSANITPKTNRPFTPHKDCLKQVYKETEPRKSISVKKDIDFPSNGMKKPLMNVRAKEDHVVKVDANMKKRPLTTGYINPVLKNLTAKRELPYESVKPRTANEVLRATKDLFAKPEWEKNLLAFGDTHARAVTAPYNSQARKPAIYDPIAKSIADYVANNVPDRLPKFPWIKKYSP